MIAEFEKQYLETANQLIEAYKKCPSSHKKELLLTIIENAELKLKKQKTSHIYLERVNTVKQGVVNAGAIEVYSSSFGEKELINLCNIQKDMFLTEIKKARKIISLALVGIYLLFSLAVLLSTFPISFLMANAVNFSAAVMISLFVTTSYSLVAVLSEKILKPLKGVIRYKNIEYKYSNIITIAVPTCLLLIYYYFLVDQFVIPYLLPFFVKTIDGVLKLNFGSIIASLGTIITYVITTATSVITLWKEIQKIYEKRKQSQLSRASKFEDDEA